MDLGGTIKEIRKQAGMSQESLSLKTGLSQTAISQIETGQKRPGKASLKKICEVLNVPEAVIFILSLQNSDVPPERKGLFDSIYPEIKSLAMRLLDGKDEK